jgi:hypothetical protein
MKASTWKPILGTKNMNLEQLFDELKGEKSLANRQDLVISALKNGVDVRAIEEMLDYLECCANTEPVNARNNSFASQTPVRSFSSVMTALFCRTHS